MSKSPQENVAYEFVFASPAVPVCLTGMIYEIGRKTAVL